MWKCEERSDEHLRNNASERSEGVKCRMKEEELKEAEVETEIRGRRFKEAEVETKIRGN